MRRAAWLSLAALTVLGLLSLGCTAVTKGSISGLIYEAGSVPHVPVQGALVTASQNGGEVASMTTLTDGAYRLSDLSPGTYTVTIQKTGFTAKEISVRVDYGDNIAGSVKRDIPLSKVRGTVSGQVKGQITGGSTIELDGATVTLSGAASAVAQTDSNGEYAFADLDDGTYQVTVSMAGFQTSAPRQVIILNGASQTSVDFTLVQ